MINDLKSKDLLLADWTALSAKKAKGDHKERISKSEIQPVYAGTVAWYVKSVTISPNYTNPVPYTINQNYKYVHFVTIFLSSNSGLKKTSLKLAWYILKSM